MKKLASYVLMRLEKQNDGRQKAPLRLSGNSVGCRTVSRVTDANCCQGRNKSTMKALTRLQFSDKQTS